MIDTTKIKDGLILLLIAGVAVGGYVVAKKVLDGVGSIGQGIANGAKHVANGVGGAIAPTVDLVKPTDTTDQASADWYNKWLETIAAGNQGA